MRHFQQVPADWLPPHCPNPNCIHHNEFAHRTNYKKIGYYCTQANPKRIPRFLCKHCHRSFSRQTFSTTYWQKKPYLDQNIFMRSVGCMGNRQMARDLGVCHETISRHLSRLGRHCMLYNQRLLQKLDKPFTEIVVDGFESFEFSQYFPLHHHVAVDKQTGYFIYFTDSELRRKGRMTAYQKQRREQLECQLGRPSPRAIELDMAETLTVSLQGAAVAVVHSDKHQAYQRSVRRVPVSIRHEVTDSRQLRDSRNPLFAVNVLDGLIRHSSSNHKRETIAFSKRRQASAEKLAIFQLWRNTMKWSSENRPGSTPAMALGLLSRRLSVSDVLGERIFRSQVELSPRWADYYARQVQTRALVRNRSHDLVYAA